MLTASVGVLMEPATGRRWTPAEVVRQVTVRANRYLEAGFCPGDRVFILFGNRLEFFSELLAVWHLGGCVVPVDERSTPFEVDVLARSASPAFCVHDEATNEATLQTLAQFGSQLFNTRDVELGQIGLLQPSSRVRLDDEALILFTSGSTGDPKGVVHTHRSLAARWITLRQSLGLAAYQRTLCMLPTHFGHGLICNCLFPWLSGCDLFVAPSFRADLLTQLGALVDKHEITFMSSVPSIWRVALRASRPPTGGSLRRIHVGSAPLSAHLWRQICDWASIPEVFNAYGITETGSWVAGTTVANFEPEDGLVGEPWGARIAVLPTSDVAAAQIGNEQCRYGEEGFIWLSTPALMKGYFQREDLTDHVVANGWFLTGDVGLVDERGLLYLKGREREEINKGGAKIFPADVDAVVERFTLSRDVCTFGYPDPLYGQNVGIAVSLSDASHETISNLHAWLKHRINQNKIPARWYLVDEIPRTSRGKINREEVMRRCLDLEPLDLAAILRSRRQ